MGTLARYISVMDCRQRGPTHCLLLACSSTCFCELTHTRTRGRTHGFVRIQVHAQYIQKEEPRNIASCTHFVWMKPTTPQTNPIHPAMLAWRPPGCLANCSFAVNFSLPQVIGIVTNPRHHRYSRPRMLVQMLTRIPTRSTRNPPKVDVDDDRSMPLPRDCKTTLACQWLGKLGKVSIRSHLLDCKILKAFCNKASSG